MEQKNDKPKRKVLVRRLRDMRPFEIAWVPKGANDVDFLVTKSANGAVEQVLMDASVLKAVLVGVHGQLTQLSLKATDVSFADEIDTLKAEVDQVLKGMVDISSIGPGGQHQEQVMPVGGQAANQQPRPLPPEHGFPLDNPSLENVKLEDDLHQQQLATGTAEDPTIGARQPENEGQCAGGGNLPSFCAAGQSGGDRLGDDLAVPGGKPMHETGQPEELEANKAWQKPWEKKDPKAADEAKACEAKKSCGGGTDAAQLADEGIRPQVAKTCTPEDEAAVEKTELSDDAHEMSCRKEWPEYQVEKAKSPPKGYPKEKAQYGDPENYAYPLDTEAHVRAALSYFSMPKNNKKYTPTERNQIWGRIVTAAKKRGIKVKATNKATNKAGCTSAVHKESPMEEQKNPMVAQMDGTPIPNSPAPTQSLPAVSSVTKADLDALAVALKASFTEALKGMVTEISSGIPGMVAKQVETIVQKSGVIVAQTVSTPAVPSATVVDSPVSDQKVKTEWPADFNSGEK